VPRATVGDDVQKCSLDDGGIKWGENVVDRNKNGKILRDNH